MLGLCEQLVSQTSSRMKPRARVAVLISGSGSNLQALIDDSLKPDSPYEIIRVLSNKADAFGLTRAQNAGIATTILSHRDFPDRESFDAALNTTLAPDQPDLVCLAGFMRILTPVFINRWQGKLINIHPSLLPKFKGLHTHARALAAGEYEHGCTVHWVVPDLDSGDIIAQAHVPVLPDDTEETLASRVLEQEHILYPRVVRELCRDFSSSA
jgi:phosphoribosylglycinamide formyltransferase 1